ncbi:MAG: hypothetical protein PVG39_21320 [Desulfobacteraceae bacterium]|jgi:hypothetical protein
MRAFIFTVLLMLVAVFSYAADIDGKWEGKVDFGGQSMDISYTFKADGNTLTGTTKGMDGNDMAIKDGKIDGNKFSYTLDMMGQAMKFNGEIKGDTIEIKADMSSMGGGGGMGGEAPPTILKKVK